MLLANFTNLGEEIEIENELWMYDYGQKMQITGLPLPEAFEVHFAWKGLEAAKVQIGFTVDGVSVVDIPNEALTQKSAVKAYIYLSTPEEGETTNQVTMYVNRRIKPEGFETPEDTDLFHHTLAAVSEYQRQAEASEKAAELSRQEVEAAKADVQKLHSDTRTAAQEAEASRDIASRYAQAAEASRVAAKESEENVRALVTGFDEHVEQEIQKSKEAITEAQQQALNALESQRDSSIQDVKDQTAEYISQKEAEAKNAITQHTASGIEKADTTLSNIKKQIDSSADTADEKNRILQKTIQDAADLNTDIGAAIKEAKEATTQATAAATQATEAAAEAEKQGSNAKNAAMEARDAVALMREELTNEIADRKASDDKKADKESLAVTDRKLDALWKLNKGISYQFEENSDEAYQKTIPSGAKLADVKSIGGKTLVWNQIAKAVENRKINGLTITKNESTGSFTVNGTSNGYVFIGSSFDITHDVHKILFRLGAVIQGNKTYATIENSQYLKGDDGIRGKIVTVNKNKKQHIPWYIYVCEENVFFDNITYTPQIFDLTQMFGEGNEPATIEEFEAMFPAEYYPYNEGELMSMPVNEVVETGKNLLNPDDVVPITFYGLSYIKNQDGSFTMKGVSTVTAKNIQIRLFADLSRSRYDNVCVFYEGMFYKMVGKEENVTLQNSLSVTKYIFAFKNINLETGKEYEFTFYPMAYCGETEPAVYSPYRKNIFQIPQAILNLPGYGCSTGTVYNYVDWENKLYVQRVGAADLGTLEYKRTKIEVDGEVIGYRFTSQSLNKAMKDPKDFSNERTIPNFCITEYTPSTFTDTMYTGFKDCIIAKTVNNNLLHITDSRYPDVESFKQAVSGVTLYYELAEEQITDISDIIDNTFQEPIEAEPRGTLTFQNANGDDYRIPVPSTAEYVVKLSEVVANETAD